MLPLQTMFSNSKNPSASRANEAARPFAWKRTQITFTELKSLITFKLIFRKKYHSRGFESKFIGP